MVEYKNEQQLNLVFHALADTTRRDLLLRLTEKHQRVTDLASNYEISLNAISKHLKVLEKASLIERKIEGRTHYCRTRPKQLKTVEKWMEPYRQFWTTSLDRLDNFLTSKKGE